MLYRSFPKSFNPKINYSEKDKLEYQNILFHLNEVLTQITIQIFLHE